MGDLQMKLRTKSQCPFDQNPNLCGNGRDCDKAIDDHGMKQVAELSDCYYAEKWLEENTP